MARKSRKNKDIIQDIEIKTFKTAIYARLSDEQIEETIENQIDIVKEYIKNKPIFKLVDIYADNGYSGTNFDRPEFLRLMEDCRNGVINCIICKDLSRFARNHIGAEDYLNNIFPFLGIRFIAITDGYDNIHIEPQQYFLTAFKNFAHAYFAQETSRKVIEAKRRLVQEGKFIGSHAPYGYKKDPLDKHNLIPDAETALVVREVFERFANGETLTNIANDFNDRNIPCPSAKSNKNFTRSIEKWSLSIVSLILAKDVYIGVLRQHINETAFYKNQQTRNVPKEEHVVIENVVPPLIERKLWEKAQKIRLERTPKRTEYPPNIYKKLLYCECGRAMCRSRNNQKIIWVCGSGCRKSYITDENLQKAVSGELKTDKITRELLLENFERIELQNVRETVFKKVTTNSKEKNQC